MTLVQIENEISIFMSWRKKVNERYQTKALKQPFIAINIIAISIAATKQQFKMESVEFEHF